MSKGLLPIVVVCAGLVAGCGSGEGSSSSTERTREETVAKVAKNPAVELEAVAEKLKGVDLGRTAPKVAIPSGPPPKRLMVKELIEGSGREARAGDRVTMQLVGMLYKRRQQFANTWDNLTPFSFNLAVHEQVAGWDHGMAGVRLGERRRVTIPPGLAYGESGALPEVPPNETLIYVVDVIRIEA